MYLGLMVCLMVCLMGWGPGLLSPSRPAGHRACLDPDGGRAGPAWLSDGQKTAACVQTAGGGAVVVPVFVPVFVPLFVFVFGFGPVFGLVPGLGARGFKGHRRAPSGW